MSKRPSPGSEGQTTQSRTRAGNGADGTSTNGNVVSWEEARLRQTLPRVIGRCMSYSAATCFDNALVAAVRSFYGIEVDVATAETDILEDDFERVRFFPWFLWDFRPPSNDGDKSAQAGPAAPPACPSVGERFLVEGELSEFERDIVRALVTSAISFVEVLHVVPAEAAIVLRDLRSGESIAIRDAGLANELAPGQVSLLRLVQPDGMPVPLELDVGPVNGFAMLDAIYAVLPPEAKPLVEAELALVLAGKDPASALVAMKTRAPELLDFAEHVLHKLTEPPTLTNVDDEAIVLCRTVVPHEGDLDTAAPLGLFMPSADPASPWVWDEDGRTVGWLRRVPAGFVVEASSRERFQRASAALAKHGVALPALHSEEELARAVAQWLAMGECEAWLTDPEVDLAFRGQLGESLNQWPDQPHPSLGRRTPREVYGEPGGDAVVARLLLRVKKVAGDAAGARLASLLA